MAVTVTEVAKNLTVAATSTTITGVSANIGDVLVAVVNISAGNATKISSSVTDPGGNTWTKQQTSLGSNGNATRAEIWTAPCTVALSAATITIQFNAQSVTAMLRILTVTGVTVTGLLGNNDNLNGAVGTTHTSVTVSPTGAACVIGTITYNGTAAPTAGPGTGWTALTGGSPISGCYGAAAYDVVGAAGTYGPAWTTGNTSSGAVTISLPQGGTQYSQTAAGTVTATATGTGTLTEALAAASTVTATATPAPSVQAAASVSTTILAGGSVALTLSMPASAVGTVTVGGSAAGTVQGAPAAASTVTALGTAAPSTQTSGAVTSQITAAGTATGTPQITVSAAGTVTATGVALATLGAPTAHYHLRPVLRVPNLRPAVRAY